MVRENKKFRFLKETAAAAAIAAAIAAYPAAASAIEVAEINIPAGSTTGYTAQDDTITVGGNTNGQAITNSGTGTAVTLTGWDNGVSVSSSDLHVNVSDDPTEWGTQPTILLNGTGTSTSIESYGTISIENNSAPTYPIQVVQQWTGNDAISMPSGSGTITVNSEQNATNVTIRGGIEMTGAGNTGTIDFTGSGSMLTGNIALKDGASLALDFTPAASSTAIFAGVASAEGGSTLTVTADDTKFVKDSSFQALSGSTVNVTLTGASSQDVATNSRYAFETTDERLAVAGQADGADSVFTETAGTGTTVRGSFAATNGGTVTLGMSGTWTGKAYVYSDLETNADDASTLTITIAKGASWGTDPDGGDMILDIGDGTSATTVTVNGTMTGMVSTVSHSDASYAATLGYDGERHLDW